jgi:hypothetical protein
MSSGTRQRGESKKEMVTMDDRKLAQLVRGRPEGKDLDRRRGRLM